MHTDMSSSYRRTVFDVSFMCVFCVFARVSLFVLGLVIRCLVYFLFVIVCALGYCLVFSTSAINCLETV